MSGCDRGGIEEKVVRKGVENVPAAERGASPSSATPSDADLLGDLAIPEGWPRDPQPRQMRVATFLAPIDDKELEVAITRFSGRVGGELANINRWRGQMGLEPIDASELETAVTRFHAPGYEGYEVRIESTSGVMLAAGVYDEAIDQTWFVRTTAPTSAAADRLKPGVFGLARSIAARGDG